MTMASVPFHLRGETLGFDRPRPWSLPALDLLFSVPRVYDPLLNAWEKRNSGTKKALQRLTEMGFVAYQGPVIIDTLTGEPAEKPERAVARYRATARGRRLLEAIEEDSGVLQEFTPKTSAENRLRVQALIEGAAIDYDDAPYGVSKRYLIEASGLAERTGRWWIGRLTEGGYLRELDEKIPDVREVIPRHWRATRTLGRHLAEIAEERTLPWAAEAMKSQYRLGRSRYLDDIDPQRVGLSGATDYDHDVGTQIILAELMRSPRMAVDGVFQVEPRFKIGVDRSSRPWRFEAQSPQTIPYQPDAEYREYEEGAVKRVILEFERFQRRRDGWGHLERFCGWVGTSLPIFEEVILRFVVDSEARARSYTALIEAYCDWLQSHPQHRITHKVEFCVASLERLRVAEDPLAPEEWSRICAPRTPEGVVPAPVIHSPKQSPYSLYF